MTWYIINVQVCFFLYQDIHVNKDRNAVLYEILVFRDYTLNFLINVRICIFMESIFILFIRARFHEQSFFAKYLHAFVSVFIINVI